MAENTTFINHFLELFYPRLCVVCGEKLISGERFICLKCLLHMPRTNFHTEPENLMEMLFYGRIHIERAAAFFEFKKGSPYQKILHGLKYKGMKKLGEFIGKQFAIELKDSDFIQEVDLIMPVPLHPKRERKRGYNQSYHLAKGLSEILNIPVENHVLRRKLYSVTQTKKTRYERWENVEDIFELANPEVLNRKHILLVDDVITTGSTLEACAQCILSRCNAKVSIATIAIA